jgi:hypothetical protein
MIVADLARAGVFCALPFVGSPAAVVALGAASGLANGLFKPAVNAGLPNLLDEDDLEARECALPDRRERDVGGRAAHRRRSRRRLLARTSRTGSTRCRSSSRRC